MERSEQVSLHGQPAKVELSRSAKGDYYWSVNVYAEDVERVVEQVARADALLRAKFLTKEETNG